MAFGGGTWITQNKVLPGAYINVVSAGIASAALSDRGIATMPVELDWGPEHRHGPCGHEVQPCIP